MEQDVHGCQIRSSLCPQRSSLLKAKEEILFPQRQSLLLKAQEKYFLSACAEKWITYTWQWYIRTKWEHPVWYNLYLMLIQRFVCCKDETVHVSISIFAHIRSACLEWVSHRHPHMLHAIILQIILGCINLVCWRCVLAAYGCPIPVTKPESFQWKTCTFDVWSCFWLLCESKIRLSDLPFGSSCCLQLPMQAAEVA